MLKLNSITNYCSKDRTLEESEVRATRPSLLHDISAGLHFKLSIKAKVFSVNIVLSNSPPRAPAPKIRRPPSPPVPAVHNSRARQNSRGSSLDSGSPASRISTTPERIVPEDIPVEGSMPTLVAKDLTQAQFEELVTQPRQ